MLDIHDISVYYYVYNTFQDNDVEHKLPHCIIYPMNICSLVSEQVVKMINFVVIIEIVSLFATMISVI